MSEMQTGQPEKRGPRWSRRLAIVGLSLLALVLLLHLYALLLAAVPVPGTILMAQRSGEGQDVRRDWVKLEDISPRLVYAVIAAEDARFCEHGGIDWRAVEAAREWNAKNPDRSRRGGSTISQQTAKNVFFWNGGGMPRKAGEAWVTYVIEAVWGKRRIMEVYLNVAEWGDGLFGAEAAAQARFGKSAADLTEREAALLAAVLPSPNRWRAVNPGPYVQSRAGSIQGRMRVVANEGYAACVLGGDAPRLPPRETPKGETPRPPPALEELPEIPETGDEALGAPEADSDAPRNRNDELNELLNAADETLRNPPRPEASEVLDAGEADFGTTPLEPLPAEEGPQDLMSPEAPEDVTIDPAPAEDESPRDLRPD